MTFITRKLQTKLAFASTLALMSLTAHACGPSTDQATPHAAPAPAAAQTLTGRALTAPKFSDRIQRILETDLAIAQAAFEIAPHREDSYIWLGRRLGYLGRYNEAVETFTDGLQAFPQSYKLYRFRGRHRARSRDFTGAISDYKAGLKNMAGIPDSFEPDGIPNSRGLTISTYRSNLHYYLGQTSFAVGEYQQMFDELEKSTTSPIALPIQDHKVAVVFWQYIALMKLGESQRARELLQTIPAEMDLIENDAYHHAVLVLQRKVSDAEVTEQGGSLSKFALGMTRIFDGERDAGLQILNQLVADSPLGYWPAEAEIVRAE